jgi:hypothetical protein
MAIVEKHGQARFKELDEALAYWLDFIDGYGEQHDWTSLERSNHRAVAEGFYLLWGAGSSTGVLPAIKAGVGFRLWVGEWIDETAIAQCWGFYGDLAKYYRRQKGDDAKKLAGVAASAAQSSANALDRERRTQWDSLFLEYGGLVLDDIADIVKWSGEVLPRDPRDAIKLGAVAAVLVGGLWLWAR